MIKKLLLCCIGLALVLTVVSIASSGDRFQVLPVEDAVTAQPPDSRAPCAMTKTNGNMVSYFGGFEPGMGNYTYFNPQVECGSPTYPFEITGFSFTLLDFTGAVWPALLDIVVYDLAASGNPCDGPVTELCRYSVSADQASFMHPTVGTYNFPAGACCVNGPFFIGIEYTGGTAGSIPSVCYDDIIPVDTCDNWFLYGGVYYEWHDIWEPPGPGYPLFWVNGETVSSNCGACDWQPGDPHKMHFPQLQDEEGWAVNATQPMILAEDFMCMETGWIKDFHFWGAWKNENEGQVMTFVLSIHEDIPADQNPDGYSKPGLTLWEMEVEEFEFTPIDPPTMEGWYDPASGEVINDDHTAYWQYNICLPELNWFWQDSGTIYWVNISAIVADAQNTTWGWKSTQNHWNDDAVWAMWGDLNWIDIWEPTDPQMNLFWIAFDPTGAIVPPMTGGVGYYGPGDVNGWWMYAQPDWEFWNIWFYDHPFSYDRQKEARIEFDIYEFEPGYPSWITLVVNYSTDIWSLEGQPPGDSMPPLPGMPPEVELMYIGRDTLYDGPVNEIPPHFIADWRIEEYNPEWISIDVFGYNFIIPEGSGMIFHDCIGSLDLSLVVTGDAPAADSGACCYPDLGGFNSLCVYTTESYCVSTLGGVYEGDGSVCAGMQACCLLDGSCVDADSLCCVNELGGIPQGPGTVCTIPEACCFADGSCADLDPLCCVDQGGVPQGPGTACTAPQACCMPDGSCADLDPLCCAQQGGTSQGPGTVCTIPKTCCFPDGTCQNLDPLCCDDAGGSPSPTGSPICLGDNNGDGVDDACEGSGWVPGDPHKMHYPQLPDEAGWDVNATEPVVLADDFMCTDTGWIKNIHFWGSWKHGNEGQILAFVLSFHEDIPADQSPTGYSMPGALLWEREINEFGYRPIDPPTMEGWYDPSTGEVIPNDHQAYFQYDVYLEEPDWFWQDSGTIYWMNISAVILDPVNTHWGWKSTTDHWNDDAVWSFWGELDWIEMYEPEISNPITNAFGVAIDPSGMFIDGFGENAFGDGWYYYPEEEWWNIWFYDHPFDSARYKYVTIEFDAFMIEPGLPAFLELAVNWSTDLWSLDQPPSDSTPPLPGEDEALYIGRATLFMEEYFEGHYVVSFTIPDYNPEWVSVDVRGFNFDIPMGLITHECIGQQSLDLSFVISSGSCCMIRGDINHDGAPSSPDIADLVYMVNYMFNAGPPPPCMEEADIDGNGLIPYPDIADLVYLVNFMFNAGPPPVPCP